MRPLQSDTTSRLVAPLREIYCQVRYYSDKNNSESSYVEWTGKNRIKQVEIIKTGCESKFFGFGVGKQAKISIIDKDRELNISQNSKFVIQIGIRTAIGISYYPMGTYFTTSATRDENTNEIKVESSDLLTELANHRLKELNLTAPYSVRTLVNAIASYIGTYAGGMDGIQEFDLSYPKGANFNESDTFRDILDDVAELTQTIYFVAFRNSATERILFKRLSQSSPVDYTIGKDSLFELKQSGRKRLTGVLSYSELGEDNVGSANLDNEGENCTQYIFENGFLDLRDDKQTLINNIAANMNGLTFYNFNCVYRGNMMLEVGDKIQFTCKDDTTFTSFFINSTLLYNGGLKETISQKFENQKNDAKPTSLGERFKQTLARVDKIKQEITLTVADVNADLKTYEGDLKDLKGDLSQISIDINGIETRVQSVEGENETFSSQIATLNVAKDSIESQVTSIQNEKNDQTGRLEAVEKAVSETITEENLKIEVSKAIDDGVTKVKTTTGFTFDETGLNISSTNSEMVTLVNNDGMEVLDNGEMVLKASHIGVEAKNLQTENFLIVGDSLFQNWKDWNGTGQRTACFWIGG